MKIIDSHRKGINLVELSDGRRGLVWEMAGGAERNYVSVRSKFTAADLLAEEIKEGVYGDDAITVEQVYGAFPAENVGVSYTKEGAELLADEINEMYPDPTPVARVEKINGAWWVTFC